MVFTSGSSPHRPRAFPDVGVAWSDVSVTETPAPLLHLVPAPQWQADPDRPYAPASLAQEGFVHCSPDVATTLAVATAFYADAPRPLLVLHLDPSRLGADVVLEAAEPAPPPGVGPDVLFPHVYGAIEREAVVRVEQVGWAGTEAVRLEDLGPTMSPDGTIRSTERRGG
jgi:uncharacterized protein (DUF952 family)